MTFLPRRQQEAQQRLRAEQATGDWRRRYALRCGVESLISQASRRSDLHHARYRGLAKTHLQHVLTALGAQPGPRGRLAHRGPNDRKLDL